MNRDKMLSARFVSAALVGGVAVGAATALTTGSESASLLLAIAAVAAAVTVINVVTGRITQREAVGWATTSVLPSVVFFSCTALGVGGSSSFDSDSQWVAALAGGVTLLLGMIVRYMVDGRRDRPSIIHPDT